MIQKSSNRRAAAKPSRENAGRAATKPARDYTRWRVACLIAVHVLFLIHILHWKLAGRTLAPLELNEVVYTLEQGIVTAGFVFMAAIVVATLLFGRFFCSWGCHILALEDLAAWLLAKLRIRPTPIRSRLLKWVPLLTMLYMFVWPQAYRLLQRRGLAGLHVHTDEQGWASFMTTDFWRNLPGPGVVLATFLVCGFVMIYVLGSRGFCTYVCPYGAVFRIADRFAPGRIVARGDCSQCGKCTAACQSHVVVHRELATFGRITDPACLKDLDCIAACPDGRIAYGLAAPSILTIGGQSRVARPAYSFTWLEEIVMAAVLLASLLIFRGLYQLMPFFLTLAVGCILAYWTVLLLRMFRRREVRFNRIHFKSAGRIAPAGWAFACMCAAVAVLLVHSGFVRYHEYNGNRIYDRATSVQSKPGDAAYEAALLRGIDHLEWCHRWGLFDPPAQMGRLAAMHASYAASVAERSRLDEAARHLQRSVQINPYSAQAQYNLGVILASMGRSREAIGPCLRAAELDPQDADAHNNLGLLLAQSGNLAAAERHLAEAMRLRPEFAAPRFNLGRVCMTLGRFEEARRLLRAASSLDANYSQYAQQLLAQMPRE